MNEKNNQDQNDTKKEREGRQEPQTVKVTKEQVPPKNSLNKKNLPEHTPMGVDALLQRTWVAYKNHFSQLIGIYLMAIVVWIAVGAGLMLIGGLGFMSSLFIAASWTFSSWGVVLLVLFVLFSALVFYLVNCFVRATVFIAIRDRAENNDVFFPFKKSFSFIFPLFWVSLLIGLITFGGYFLFIIPGIVFAVWFSFAPFVLIAENVRGVDALSKSREYVRGYWWAIFGRILLLMAIGIVVWIVGVIFSFIPFGGVIVGVVTAPFFVLYMYLLYEDMKRVQGSVPSQASTNQKIIYGIFGFLGIALPPLLVVLVTLIFLSMV